MDKAHKSFLGTGWSFPPQFDRKSGQTVLESDVADINSSLHILLSTRKGERVMQPTYGCNLEEMVFEPITTTFKTYMIDLIETAILYHEPRIRVDRIDIEQTDASGEVITVSIEYTVRATNSRFNFVYPFYDNEATELDK